ncbi:MAG: hypothetical protein WAT37_11710 [Saprospiraceae bacterium]
MQDYISIETIKEKYYNDAERYFVNSQNWQLTFSVLSFLLLFLILFFDQFKYIIDIGSILLVLGLNIVLIYFNYKYQMNRHFAEELRRIQFNFTNLHLPLSPEDKSHLLPQIIKQNIKEFKDYVVDYNGEYFENQNIKFSLLQNIYLTSQNYKNNSKFYKKWMSLLFLYFVIVLFILIILINSIGIEITFSYIPQVFLILVNLLLGLQVFTISKSFEKKSESLKILDYKISKLGIDQLNEIYGILIEFNIIVSGAYPTRKSIYHRNKSLLNLAWRERIKGLNARDIVPILQDRLFPKITSLFDPNPKLRISEYKIIGSFNNGNFINTKSDLDVLMVFENADNLSPSGFFKSVHRILLNKFGANLKISYPAIILHTINDVVLELVPCIKKDNKYLIYDKVTNAFIQINYEELQQYFDNLDVNSNFTYSKVVFKMKEWKYENTVNIPSIYLQLKIAEIFGKNVTNNKTSKDLILEVIDYLIDDDFCPVMNPTNSNEVSISDDIDKTKLKDKFNKYKDKITKNE